MCQLSIFNFTRNSQVVESGWLFHRLYFSWLACNEPHLLFTVQRTLELCHLKNQADCNRLTTSFCPLTYCDRSSYQILTFNIAVLLVAVNALLGLGLMVCVVPAGLCAITPATPAPPAATPPPAAGVHRVCLCAINADIGNCFLHLPHWNMSSSSAEIQRMISFLNGPCKCPVANPVMKGTIKRLQQILL